MNRADMVVLRDLAGIAIAELKDGSVVDGELQRPANPLIVIGLER